MQETTTSWKNTVCAWLMAQFVCGDSASVPRTTRLLPQTYFLAALALMLVMHFMLPIKMPIPFHWCLAGMLPISMGITLNIVADRQFREHATTTKSFHRPITLVTHGVFRVSRNPMYLGMVLVAAGIALLAGEACSWLSVGALAVLLHRIFIVPEEAIIRETFGAEAEAYISRVRRWL